MSRAPITKSLSDSRDGALPFARLGAMWVARMRSQRSKAGAEKLSNADPAMYWSLSSLMRQRLDGGTMSWHEGTAPEDAGKLRLWLCRLKHVLIWSQNSRLAAVIFGRQMSASMFLYLGLGRGR